MLSTRVTSLITKALVVFAGVMLGWLHANSYELIPGSKYTSYDVQSIDNSSVHPTVIPDDVEVATKLAEIVRLLCLVPTTRNQHKEDATSLKNTWGWHCNKLLFVTDEFDEYVNASTAIVYNSTNKNETSWHKVKYALHHIYENLWDDFDWVLKAEQSNYAVVENVRFMLHNVSTSQPRVVARCVAPSKIDDGSAYLLNREALRKLVDDGFATGTNCSSEQSVQNEFTKISECLVEAQVDFVESHDANGRALILKETVSNTIQALASPNEFRTEVSNFTAVWPSATPHDMYIFNFFIYDVRSYGAPQDMPPLTP